MNGSNRLATHDKIPEVTCAHGQRVNETILNKYNNHSQMSLTQGRDGTIKDGCCMDDLRENV